MKVKEVMRQAYIVDKDITLLQAAKMMSAKKITSLLILENNQLKGILTEGDLMRNFGKNIRVTEAMSTTLITIEGTEDLSRALELMLEHGIKKLPVMEDKALIGIISLSDIASYPEELEEDFFFE